MGGTGILGYKGLHSPCSGIVLFESGLGLV